jgi:uncharacterized protein (UPF0335 family)
VTEVSEKLSEYLERLEPLSEDEMDEVMDLTIQVFFEDQGKAFAARAALAQMYVGGLLPYEP